MLKMDQIFIVFIINFNYSYLICHTVDFFSFYFLFSIIILYARVEEIFIFFIINKELKLLRLN